MKLVRKLCGYETEELESRPTDRPSITAEVCNQFALAVDEFGLKHFIAVFSDTQRDAGVLVTFSSHQLRVNLECGRRQSTSSKLLI